jgi:GT2 family glycosyltransferase
LSLAEQAVEKCIYSLQHMNQAIPDITVILCTRNGARTIQTAVRCCIEAARFDPECRVELLVIDNGSTDDTASIVRALLEPCADWAQLLHEPQPGKVFAMQAGLRRAAGAVVCTIDDDTFAEPQFLSRACRFFAERPDVGVVGSRNDLDPAISPPDWFAWTATRYACTQPLLREPVEHDSLGREVAAEGFISGAGMTFRKAPVLAALAAGYRFFNTGRRERGVQIAGEDIETCLLIRSMGYKIGFDPLMRLRHSIAPQRLTMEAFHTICQSIGAGSLGSDPFLFATGTTGPLGRLRLSWPWQIGSKIRQMWRLSGSAAFRDLAAEEKRFQVQATRTELWAAVVRMARERSRYTAHMRNVCHGPWTRLRTS